MCDTNAFLDNLILEETINTLMEMAGKFHDYNGEEKKEFVLTKTNQFALENKLHFNEELIS